MFYQTKKCFWMDPKIIRLQQLQNQLPEAAQAERRNGKDGRRKKLEDQHRIPKHVGRGMQEEDFGTCKTCKWKVYRYRLAKLPEPVFQQT